MTRDEFLEKYGDHIGDEEIMFADGFDDALVGLDIVDHRVIYDSGKMAEILVKDEGMELIDAIEYLEYNVYNAYVGEKTPIYII
jgi:hypothetical protein